MNAMKQAIAAAALEPLRSPEPGVFERRFRFDSDFPGFAGHFPGYPVLPAVVQVLTAVTVAEAARGGTLELAALENAKFLIQLRPGDEILVRCLEKCLAGRPVWEGSLTVAAGTAASFLLTLEEEAC